MSVTRVTFIGGGVYGNLATAYWLNPSTGQKITFPIHEPVDLDPDAATSSDEHDHIVTVLRKVRKDQSFKVEDVGEPRTGEQQPQHGPLPPPPPPQPQQHANGDGDDDDDDGDEDDEGVRRTAERTAPPPKPKPRSKSKPRRKR